jgi:hypothetical protein
MEFVLEKPGKQLNVWLLFLIISSLLLLIVYYNEQFLFTKQFFYNSYSEQLALERIDAMVETRKKYSWLAYIFVPVVLMLKISYFTSCVSISNYFFSGKFSFTTLFRICLTGELVFIVMQFCRVLYFEFIHQPQSIDDIYSITSLSLYNLLGPSESMSWFAYPLQTINVWEVLYCLFCTQLMSETNKRPFSENTRTFLIGYGTGLLLLIILVVFLSVNLN